MSEYSINLSKKIVKYLDDKKAHNIKLLKVINQTVIADYFIIASGTSSTQIKGLCDEVEFRCKEEDGIMCSGREGYDHANWIVLDFDSVIVHVFNKETRDLFKLEKLWADAEEIDISDMITD